MICFHHLINYTCEVRYQGLPVDFGGKLIIFNFLIFARFIASQKTIRRPNEVFTHISASFSDHRDQNEFFTFNRS